MLNKWFPKHFTLLLHSIHYLSIYFSNGFMIPHPYIYCISVYSGKKNLLLNFCFQWIIMTGIPTGSSWPVSFMMYFLEIETFFLVQQDYFILKTVLLLLNFFQLLKPHKIQSPDYNLSKIKRFSVSLTSIAFSLKKWTDPRWHVLINV